jgi:hypothetical protein
MVQYEIRKTIPYTSDTIILVVGSMVVNCSIVVLALLYK